MNQNILSVCTASTLSQRISPVSFQHQREKKKNKNKIKFRPKPSRDTPGSSKAYDTGKALQCTVSRLPAQFCTKKGKITTERFEIERLTLRETESSCASTATSPKIRPPKMKKPERHVYTLAHHSGDKLTFLPLLPLMFPTWGAWERPRHLSGRSLTEEKAQSTWWVQSTLSKC